MADEGIELESIGDETQSPRSDEIIRPDDPPGHRLNSRGHNDILIDEEEMGRTSGSPSTVAHGSGHSQDSPSGHLSIGTSSGTVTGVPVVRPGGTSKQALLAKPIPDPDEPATDPIEANNELFDLAREIRVPVINFEEGLRRLIKRNKLDSTIQDSDGLNLLMVAMQAKNLPAMRSIYYVGAWKLFRDHVIRQNSDRQDIAGKNVLEFAKDKVKSKKILTEVGKLDALEASLSDLHKAARAGDVEKVRNLLQEGPQEELSRRDSEGNSPLHHACVSGSLKVVEALLEAGASAKANNHNDQNLLHITAKHAHDEILKYLILRNEVDLSLKDSIKKSPILYTAENGSIESLKIFNTFDANIEPEILGTAAQHGCLEYLQFAVEKLEINPNFIDKNGKTLLHHACLHGHIKVILYVLEKVSDIAQFLLKKERAGRNFLHICCESEADLSEIMKRLLEKAKEHGVLESLIDERDFYTGIGTCVLVSGKDKGRPAYHYVETNRCTASIFESKVRSGLVDVAKYGVVVKSGWGESPGQEVITEVENMLFSRVEPSKNPPKDSTPLHIAVFKEKVALAKLLLEYGANVNIQDSFGLSPMHLASMRGNIELLKALQKAKADPALKDANGKDAVEIAKDNDHPNVVHYMLGKNHLQLSQRFVDDLSRKMKMFSKEELERLRNEGKDVRKHLITSLRDVQIDVNILLMALGSSPIMEESTE